MFGPIVERHSVRKYLDKKIPMDLRLILEDEIKEINIESGLHFQAVYDDPEPFSRNISHYGAFQCCKNYFVLCGKKGMDEEIGYYGERLVLRCQTVGLNTCWVAASYKKKSIKCNVEKDEIVYLIIAFGYGAEKGGPHLSKPANEVSNIEKNSPTWFKNGVLGTLYAPTAMNQQQYYLILTDDNTVIANAKNGPYSKVDLGIVKYHFEIASGMSKYIWD